MTRTVFIIAGEASGDILGASLMQDLKLVTGNDIDFSGVGGDLMNKQGLNSLFPMSDLSVMGLAEVLKHLPKILGRLNQTVTAILEQKPDVLVTIDSPDFCLRVAKKIKRKNPNIKIVHMVAPTVWAWRPKRAQKMAKFLDGLMCLFPFEPVYFTKYDLKTRFVGHPLTRQIPAFSEASKRGFCVRHGLDESKPLLCLLPGSRSAEIDALMPVLLETFSLLKHSIPELQCILPTLPHKKAVIESYLKGNRDIHVLVPETPHEKYTAFAACDVALHASGTVALELALCNTPMITTYKVNAITAWVGRRLIKTPYVNLVNILVDHPIVPELLQEKANARDLSAIVHALLTIEALRELQSEQLKSVTDILKENTPQSAAHFVESFF
jgi:lipid-A-disaccharide synthase